MILSTQILIEKVLIEYRTIKQQAIFELGGYQISEHFQDLFRFCNTGSSNSYFIDS